MAGEYGEAVEALFRPKKSETAEAGDGEAVEKIAKPKAKAGAKRKK
jgi:hypothetical protein